MTAGDSKYVYQHNWLFKINGCWQRASHELENQAIFTKANVPLELQHTPECPRQMTWKSGQCPNWEPLTNTQIGKYKTMFVICKFVTVLCKCLMPNVLHKNAPIQSSRCQKIWASKCCLTNKCKDSILKNQGNVTDFVSRAVRAEEKA